MRSGGSRERGSHTDDRPGSDGEMEEGDTVKTSWVCPVSEVAGRKTRHTTGSVVGRLSNGMDEYYIVLERRFVS